MADTFPRIPFQEAVDALERRGTRLFPSDHWATVWQEQHHTGFTVARSAGFDILDDIYKATLTREKSGMTFHQFKKELIPVLQQKGWWGTVMQADPATGEQRLVQLGSVRRLRTIFDVNMRVSRAQGHWRQQQLSKEAFPYLRYVALLDSRTRPHHRIWHDPISPIDPPWWKTHYPPTGWGCRCDAESVSEEWLQRNGMKVSEPPSDGTRPWINPVTGEVIEVPAGIDPGWAYNPGAMDQSARMADRMLEKAAALPVNLEGTALMQAAPLLPEAALAPGGTASQAITRMVREGFEEWAENPITPLPLAVLSAEDAASIGASARVAVLSAETLKKQLLRHPELKDAECALAEEVVEKGERLPQAGNKLAFALDRPGGLALIVKATRVGDELYITSLYRLSGLAARRVKALRNLGKK